MTKNTSTKIRIFLFFLFVFLGTINFAQSRYIPQQTKKIVFARDGGSCRCCGSSLELEFDHITPFSCGGTSVASNIQLLCKTCNRSKSNSCFCKIHDKKVGTNCCDKKSKSSTIKNSVQCSGITKKGNRCKNRTLDSSGRCHLH